MKPCKKCKEEKPLSGFYAHKNMFDGHLNICKSCVKERVMQHRLNNIDRIRAYDLKRSKLKHRIKLATEQTRRWRAEDERRQKCHAAVAKAIRNGDLVQSPCSRCGEEKSLAHHESYERPVDVVWLCYACHKVRHKEMVIAGIEP